MRRHGLECLRGTPYRRVDRSGIPARSSPFDTACSEVPVSYSVLSDSSPITAPFLLPKHTRSKGPSLPRHYPASQVPLTLSDAQMARHPKDDVRGSRLLDHPGPPPLTQIAFLTCHAHYPGGRIGAAGYDK